MPDFDLRLVRYFTVVAEHLNFGRAAAALHLAQPSLSRQIQRLEHQLGVRLFDRTPQGSHFTEAGEAFLPQARALLAAADQAASVARASAPARSITVGYTDALVITPAVRELRRRHPDAQVHTRHLDWTTAPAALLERRVDALVARAPLATPSDKLRETVLYEEPRVLVVPVFHRLAGRASVTPEDLADEKHVPCPNATSEWEAFAHLEPRPDGRPVRVTSVQIDGLEEKLEAVAEGQAIVLLPHGRPPPLPPRRPGHGAGRGNRSVPRGGRHPGG